ncbi:MAG: hypothetical protein AAFS10_17245 [Myxococcota bacterium]
MKPNHALLALFALCTAALLFSASPASAQDLGSCGEYAQQFCAGTKPGGLRVTRCLKKHLDDLPFSCKRTLKKHADAIKEACAADVKSLCTDASKNKQACLREHKDKLSATCKASFQKAP